MSAFHFFDISLLPSSSKVLGMCRLHIHIKRTREFYSSQPKISANCLCDYCKYFETEVINRPNRLFELLNNMEVDLSRQPNLNPDGISCVGETRRDKLGYVGNYFVYGYIGKTSKKTKIKKDDDTISEVAFNDTEFGANTRVYEGEGEPKIFALKRPNLYDPEYFIKEPLVYKVSFM